MAMMDIIPLDDRTHRMVLALMNAEHPDAIRLYANHFGGRPTAKSATLTHVNSESMSVRYVCPSGEEGEVSIPYVDESGAPLSVATVGDCRRALVVMARVASVALGEPIALPEIRRTDLPGGESEASQNQPPPEGIQEMVEMMQELMRRRTEEVQQETSTIDSEVLETKRSGLDRAPASRVHSLTDRGVAASTTSHVFQGEGCRLGSSNATASNEAAQQDLREVDPEKPLVRLRVQMLDRKPATVTVNRDFSVGDLCAWLRHHQSALSTNSFNLMDVSAFPPRKLGDMNATLEQLGLSKNSSLSCRPA